MSTLENSARLAPDFAWIRAVIANDAGTPITDKELGVNMAGFRFAIFNVIPGATGNPVVEFQLWDPASAKYIQQHTPLSYGAKGNGVAWQAVIECHSQWVLPKVTAGAGAGTARVDFYAAGAEWRPQ